MTSVLLCSPGLSSSSHLVQAIFPLCIKTLESLRHLNYVLLALCCQSRIDCLLLYPEGTFWIFSERLFLRLLFFITTQESGGFQHGVPAPEEINERMTFCCRLIALQYYAFCRIRSFAHLLPHTLLHRLTSLVDLREVHKQTKEAPQVKYPWGFFAEFVGEIMK